MHEVHEIFEGVRLGGIVIGGSFLIWLGAELLAGWREDRQRRRRRGR
jgi:hypothetical protein